MKLTAPHMLELINEGNYSHAFDTLANTVRKHPGSQTEKKKLVNQMVHKLLLLPLPIEHLQRVVTIASSKHLTLSQKLDEINEKSRQSAILVDTFEPSKDDIEEDTFELSKDDIERDRALEELLTMQNTQSDKRNHDKREHIVARIVSVAAVGFALEYALKKKRQTPLEQNSKSSNPPSSQKQSITTLQSFWVKLTNQTSSSQDQAYFLKL